MPVASVTSRFGPALFGRPSPFLPRLDEVFCAAWRALLSFPAAAGRTLTHCDSTRRSGKIIHYVRALSFWARCPHTLSPWRRGKGKKWSHHPMTPLASISVATRHSIPSLRPAFTFSSALDLFVPVCRDLIGVLPALPGPSPAAINGVVRQRRRFINSIACRICRPLRLSFFA